DLSEDDKKSFHQSIADRVHESVAAQEREHGQEDSQSAEAREHEALGEEHAQGKGDVSELHEKDDTAEEKREDRAEEAREDAHEERQDDGMEDLKARVAALEARLGKADADDEALRKAENVYGLGNGVFQAAKEESGNISPKEAADIVRRIKN
ncbi:MAG: hypothetical protein K2L51_04880, partial [Clostridiales bacterium]|nr:hypothetical protein [Clostridiales bacterium]